MALDNCKLIGSGGLENKVIVVTTSAGDVPNQTFHIIPNPGFSVSAESFSVFDTTYGANGNSLVYNAPATNYTSITLSNTTTAHAEDNKVKILVNLVDSYVISSDTVLPIDLDGKAIEIQYPVDVIPHVLDSAYDMPFPNLALTIDKVSDNPPVINSTSKLTHSHSFVPFDITYLPCTIQPSTLTKIATITVDVPSGAWEASGAYWSITTPPYIDSIGGEASYGLSGVLKYELVEVVSSQVVQSNNAVTRRVYELFFQNHESHDFVGSIWPSSYNTVGASAYTDACRLVLTRPVYVNALESSTGNTIDNINMNDDIPVLAPTDPPVKTIDDGVTGLFNTGSLNPNGGYLSDATGIINKVTEDEPNLVSIQGTPGTTFQFSMEEDGSTKADIAGLPSGVQTIPDSGVFVGKMTNIPENGTTAGKAFDLTITTTGTSAVSQSAGRPQQQKPGTSIAATEANSIVLRYTQPVKEANIKITGSDSNSNTSTALGTTDPSDATKCLAASITGLGTSLVSTQSHLAGIDEVVDFTMQRQGGTGFTNSKMVITGTARFLKFGGSNVQLDIDFDDIFARGSGSQFSIKKQPTDAITDGVVVNQVEALGDFTITPTGNNGATPPVNNNTDVTGVQVQITNLVATVVATSSP